MVLINIVCKINEEDTFQISEQSVLLHLYKHDQIHYTFFNYSKNENLLKIPHFFSNEGLDLFYLSLVIYYADRIIKRDSFPDAWTRKFKLFFPVLELEKWINNKKIIEDMLSFLSGDNWEIVFRKRMLNHNEFEAKKRIEESTVEKLIPNMMCMISGGLDSYIGAIDLLQTDKKIFFVSLYGGGRGVLFSQKTVKDALINKHQIVSDNFLSFYAAPIGGREDTTRTRSFMFFAHAIAVASAYRKDINLIIPENGLISLNIPLTNSRIGSSSTRTTHPHYIKLFQMLLNNLDLKISLKNPYQFKTKGEMIKGCKDLTFLKESINSTISCSHPDLERYRGRSDHLHCGTCLPCIIRRAAIKKSGIHDNTEYKDRNFEEISAKIKLKAYKLGLLKYRMNIDNLIYYIQTSGPITECYDDYMNLYSRGMDEISGLLDSYE